MGGPKDSNIRQAFQRENPNSVVRDVYVSEATVMRFTHG